MLGIRRARDGEARLMKGRQSNWERDSVGVVQTGAVVLEGFHRKDEVKRDRSHNLCGDLMSGRLR